MSAIPGGDIVDLSGTVHVPIVSAPPAGTYRVVLWVRVFNRDSASVTVTLISDEAGTVEREIDRATGLAVNGVKDFLTRDRPYVLDTPDKSLEAYMSAPPAATNPVIHVSWLDIT